MLILPHSIACEEAWKRNVILLSEPGYTSNNIKLIKLRAKNCLHVEFDDINKIIEGYKAPCIEDIEKILEFAKTHEVGLVSCFAGVSRSSAVAYLIQCLTRHPKDAILILDKDRYSPNSRVVKIGAKLLNNREILMEYERWLRRNSNESWVS